MPRTRDKDTREIIERDAVDAASLSPVHPGLVTLAHLLSELCAQDLLQPPERSASHDEDDEA